MDEETLFIADRFRVVRKVGTTAGGQPHAREVIRHPGAVVILPLLDDGRVVLIRNRRISVDRTLIELPAGTLDRGEEPLDAAHRELAEETGYRARSMERLTSFYASPGILDERMHLYLARGLERGAQALEKGEEIEVLLVAQEDALGLVAEGVIEDAKTLVGLLYYDRFGRGKAGP